MALYDRIVDPDLLVRRVYVVANRVADESTVTREEKPFEQLDLFTDYAAEKERRLQRERSIQEMVLKMKKKYGKNAILKGMNLEEGAMTVERNRQIGGHKA